MSKTINPAYFAAYFTAEEIKAKIDSILENIAIAEASVKDSFSDTQAQQQIQRQKLDALYASLELWIEAGLKQADDPSVYATIIAARYTGRRALPSITGITI